MTTPSTGLAVHRFAAVILTGLALACGSPTEPERTPVLGTVGYFFANDPSIHVPDSVSAGARFDVRVRTYGSGCHSKGILEVEETAEATIVTPYDHVSGGPVCDAVLRVYDHFTSLRLDTPGTAKIIVYGATDLPRDTLEIEFDVWVR